MIPVLEAFAIYCATTKVVRRLVIVTAEYRSAKPGRKRA
jgi:hypothetical protein